MLSSSDRATAVERATAGAEATATLEGNVSGACSGSGNDRVGTRDVLEGGGHGLPLLRLGDVWSLWLPYGIKRRWGV